MQSIVDTIYEMRARPLMILSFEELKVNKLAVIQEEMCGSDLSEYC